MPNFQRTVARLTGKIYIPSSAKNISGKTLLHLSDTPAMILSDIQKLIQVIQPDYIVHTGDMVDNIKLELYPSRFKDYSKQLKKLRKVLEGSLNTEIFIATGNHDNFDLVNTLFSKSKVYSEATNLIIDGHSIRISHYASTIHDIHPDTEYSLFGHDLTMPSHVDGHITYLNGIEHIYLIDLSNKSIIPIQYPAGTNDSRLNRHRIGI